MPTPRLKKNLSKTGSVVLILCSIGLAVSAYALHVELAAGKNNSYTALCDLSESISCSKVFTSRYGRGFGLVDRIVSKDSIFNQPNSIFGILFYLLQSILVLTPSMTNATIQLITALVSNAGSLYLGCILYFVLEDMCVVCVTSYTINFFLLICTFIIYNQALKQSRRKQS